MRSMWRGDDAVVVLGEDREDSRQEVACPCLNLHHGQPVEDQVVTEDQR